MTVLQNFIRGNVKIFILALTAVSLYLTAGSNIAYVERDHGQVEMTVENFTESTKKLVNPNRGFYSIYGVVPSDKEDNFQQWVERVAARDSKPLLMIQVNLRNYTSGPISEKGLENIKILFDALRELNKQYVVRFLYDWNGKNLETEPQDIEIILEHMRQLECIFREFSDIIFIQQSLFVGNCGELHGTKYVADMPRLALQLAAVTEEKTYLAVRTPAQWRTVTGIAEISEEAWYGSSLVRRMSLFNDGILGNIWDCGTYGAHSRSQTGDYGKWIREEELLFQEELCKIVPNGGEVIIENSLNDFESAVENLRTMHITYLNQDYDRKVLNKWSESIYTGDDCFYGMDGLSYIERHLGYRLFIKEVTADYDFWKDILSVNISLQNVGFAPMYREPEIYLAVQQEESKEVHTFKLSENVGVLAGGNEKEEVLTIQAEILLQEYLEGEYRVYFFMVDTDSGMHIQLANEQDEQEQGYLIGKIQIGRKE